MGIESAAVPVHTLPDGNQFITDQDCLEHPEIASFVERFSRYWNHDPVLCGYVGPPADPRKAYEKGWSLERLRRCFHLSEGELRDVAPEEFIEDPQPEGNIGGY